MKLLFPRIFLAALLITIPACGSLPSTSDEEATMDFEIVPSDPASIARWEKGQSNVFRAKLEVVPLKCFRDKLTEKGHNEAKPVAVEMCGALASGVAAEQGEALRRFVETESDVFARVRTAIYDDYRKNYSTRKQGLSLGAALFGGNEADLRKMLPEIVKGNELDGVISFRTINVSRPENGTSRIGIVLGCPWDEENGLGVVITNGEVAQVGDAGTAILGVVPKPVSRVRRVFEDAPISVRR